MIYLGMVYAAEPAEFKLPSAMGIDFCWRM
jgi:hypothetical protein